MKNVINFCLQTIQSNEFVQHALIRIINEQQQQKILSYITNKDV